jgi:hypothetical protein
MVKRKISISTTEVVELVRNGTSNRDLGKRYGLSPRGVRRLYEKLVDAGRLSATEAPFQPRSPRNADAVTVAHTIFPSRTKKTINGKNAVHDIRCGLTDVEMMDKYGLSVKGLSRLYGKLTLAGLITQNELDERRRDHEWAAQVFPSKVKDETTSPGPNLAESTLETDPPGFYQRHKLKVQASLCVAAGICLVVASVAILSFGVKVVKAMVIHRTQSAEKNTLEAGDADIDRSIDALRSIAEPKATTSQSDGNAQSEEYRNCLKSCDDDNSGSGDDENVMRANCRRECVTQHSPRLKRIRETYYK